MKNAIETMTGLKVVEINVFVQSIAFEPVETPAQKAEKRKAAKEEAAEAKKAAEPLPEPPRVK